MSSSITIRSEDLNQGFHASGGGRADRGCTVRKYISGGALLDNTYQGGELLENTYQGVHSLHC